MRAIVIAENGGAEVLRWDEVPEPEPGPGELLVSVEAAGVNFIDIYHRRGLYQMELPMIPGMEGAGSVLAVGGEDDEFVTGDRVGWSDVLGSYSERLVVPASRAIPVPDGVEAATAAAVLLQGLTAHFLANDTFPLSAGDRCLIHAGSGGVGHLLTQIAKSKGAEVFTTVGTEEKAELSREAGSDHVILYDKVDFKAAVEEIAGPNAMDVVYDGVGASTFDSSLDVLRPRGMMVSFGNASGPPREISPLVLASKGSIYLTRPTMRHYLATRGELLGRAADLFSMIEHGRLKVNIGAEFELSQAAVAQAALESRSTTGKVILLTGPGSGTH